MQCLGRLARSGVSESDFGHTPKSQKHLWLTSEVLMPDLEMQYPRVV
jgi:hypothetical protein